MRPIKTNGEEEVGGGNLMREKSLVPAVQEVWSTWEIQFLMLVSLFLQVFLFLFAGMRRRNASPILRTVLWLAYLSADSVAIFVLGHLAVHAGEPGHQLLSFWAPFLLVHLGGQDTITAFSKQDNELWRRHLLSLVTQVGVAVYVVAKASWPDHRLRAAMILIFLSGCFKYAERTFCLFLMSTLRLLVSKETLAETLKMLQVNRDKERSVRAVRKVLDAMSKGNAGAPLESNTGVTFIPSVDAPLNTVESILAADELPGILAEFQSGSNNHRRAYQYVEAFLGLSYRILYTKLPLREGLYNVYTNFFRDIGAGDIETCLAYCVIVAIFLYPIFEFFSAPIALLLFTAAEKGDQGQLHAASRADVIVSYILLVGAIILDVSSITMFILSRYFALQPALWIRRQWSEELAQYSMIKRHAAVQEAVSMASIRLRIGKCLGDWAIRYLEVTNTPTTEDRTSIKKFILDSLLLSGTRREWNIASTRGRLALRKWMERHQATPNSDSASPGPKKKALIGSVNSGIDFPTSLLIWHIATDICYYTSSTRDSDDDQLKKHKQMSKELSNYIMYIVFKCGVMLTDNSQLLHDKVHDEIRDVLSSSDHQQAGLGEKDAFTKIFSDNKEKGGHQVPQGHQAPLDSDDHMQKLLQSAEALRSPFLPRACVVAQELISIKNEAERWDLIASVWSEMLFYIAPRCGGAFHYEHLSTGGEFITHVLVLMYLLGPFLPGPGA